MSWRLFAFLVVAAVIIAFASAFLPVYAAGRQCGVASHYGAESGRRTANGERFPTAEATAAHRWLAFNSRVRVTDMRTGRAVTVRINDRGPYIRGRIIDLSPAAARRLGMGGLARVCISD